MVRLTDWGSCDIIQDSRKNMSFIDDMIRNTKKYKAEDLSVVFVQKIETIHDYKSGRIFDYMPEYAIFVAKPLKKQSSPLFRRYYLLTQEKIVDDMPAVYCNKGDNVVTKSLSFEHFCKHRVGVDVPKIKFSLIKYLPLLI